MNCYSYIQVIGAFASGASTFVQTVGGGEATCTNIPGDIDFQMAQFTKGKDHATWVCKVPRNRWFTELFYNQLPGKMIGYVVIVDGSFPETFREARSIIQTCQAYSDRPFIVFANPRSKENSWNIDALRNALRLPEIIPIVEGDAKNRNSTVEALLILLNQIAIKDAGDTQEQHQETVLPIDQLYEHECEYAWIVFASTWGGQAGQFMQDIKDGYIWLSLDDEHHPEYYGYIEADTSLRVYIDLHEGFAEVTEPHINN